LLKALGDNEATLKHYLSAVEEAPNVCQILLFCIQVIFFVLARSVFVFVDFSECVFSVRLGEVLLGAQAGGRRGERP
jgi:hypothetical protein